MKLDPQDLVIGSTFLIGIHKGSRVGNSVWPPHTLKKTQDAVKCARLSLFCLPHSFELIRKTAHLLHNKYFFKNTFIDNKSNSGGISNNNYILKIIK